MFSESTVAGYIVRYIVPIHLAVLFKRHLVSIGAISRQDNSLAVTLFTVSGDRDKHQRLQEFLKDCRKERRALPILNWNVKKVAIEAKMWGLDLEVVKRGILFTRTAVIGETQVLDRLERYLNSRSLL